MINWKEEGLRVFHTFSFWYKMDQQTSNKMINRGIDNLGLLTAFFAWVVFGDTYC